MGTYTSTVFFIALIFERNRERNSRLRKEKKRTPLKLSNKYCSAMPYHYYPMSPFSCVNRAVLHHLVEV